MKIAHVSDLHVDERGRLDDVVAVLDAFIGQARDAQVDLILLAGDNFERRSTPRERMAFARFLQKASEVAPVFGVKGNHDQAEDLSVFNLLETDRQVLIVDRPLDMSTGAAVWNLGEGRRVGLLPLPWFDRAHLVAQLEATVEAETTRLMTIAAARQLLNAYTMEASRLRGEGIVPILVGHVLVAGSETSTGQTLIGTTVELAPSDILATGVAYAALGHIHKAQEWFGGRVAYSGSPHRCNYGEPEAKGWRLVTLEDDGTFVSNEFMELPARRIVLIEADLSNPAVFLHKDGTPASSVQVWTSCDAADLHGALVRYRYRVRAEDLHRVDEAELTVAFLELGAAEVQIEAVVVTETRARAPEIVNVQTTAEKVDAYLQAKQIPVDEPTRERLHAKVGLLEGA